ncbi:transporter substrate-binding domain-containing protein [uncultured Rhodoferax sp.]|uniref:substrate-binding periplasmic protein n=1 Tax=uncultured Rhodoferax sp. TaxID=223188 RepID=UPI0025F68C30|nr:transporter substrate-binding domain-containing protein [uncultured Rhodoferax sp.]
MNRRAPSLLRKVFWVCSGLLLGQALAAEPAHPTPATLRLCYEDATILPWRTADGRGLNFELLQQVGQQLGVTLTYLPLPWKRCLASLQANEVDGAFAASFSAERLDMGAYPGGKQADPAKRMHNDRYVLLRRKGSTVQWDGKQISNLEGPVGVQLGYSIAAQLRGKGVAVDENNQGALALARRLMLGRVGAVAMGGSDATMLFAQPDIANQLEELPLPLTEKSYYLMLSHQLLATQPELAQRIWKTMETVRNSPAYKKQERQAMELMPE